MSQVQITRLPAVIRAASAWTGLGMIAYAAVSYTDTTKFPGLAASIPVIGSGLMLAADDPTGGPGKVGLLNNPVAKYLGDISFSIYLWHFPCIVLAQGYFADRGVRYYLWAGMLPLLLSIVSYHLIENPIRHSNWLSAKPARYKRRSAGVWFDDNRKTLDGLMVLGGVVILGGAALVMRVPTLPAESGQALPAVAVGALDKAPADGGPSGAPSRVFAGPASVAELGKQISAALTSQQYPRLSPSINDVITSRKQAPNDILNCSSPGASIRPCVWSSDAPITHHAVLVGDSIAMTFGAPLRQAAYDHPGWGVTDMAQWGCKFTTISATTGDPHARAECPGAKQRAVNYIRANHPEVLFVANIYSDGVAPGVEGMLRPLLAYVGKVVILGAPPVDKNIVSCYRPNGKPSECVSHLTEDWKANEQAVQGIAASVGAVYVDTTPLYCTADGNCPAFVGNTIVKVDADHMTPEYQYLIRRPFEELLKSAGVSL